MSAVTTVAAQAVNVAVADLAREMGATVVQTRVTPSGRGVSVQLAVPLNVVELAAKFGAAIKSHTDIVACHADVDDVPVTFWADLTGGAA